MHSKASEIKTISPLRAHISVPNNWFMVLLNASNLLLALFLEFLIIHIVQRISNNIFCFKESLSWESLHIIRDVLGLSLYIQKYKYALRNYMWRSRTEYWCLMSECCSQWYSGMQCWNMIYKVYVGLCYTAVLTFSCLFQMIYCGNTFGNICVSIEKPDATPWSLGGKRQFVENVLWHHHSV